MINNYRAPHSTETRYLAPKERREPPAPVVSLAEVRQQAQISCARVTGGCEGPLVEERNYGGADYSGSHVDVRACGKVCADEIAQKCELAKLVEKVRQRIEVNYPQPDPVIPPDVPEEEEFEAVRGFDEDDPLPPSLKLVA